jgi:hypothetical protein
MSRARWWRPHVMAMLALFTLPVFGESLPGAPPEQYQAFSSQDRRIRDRQTSLVWERSVSPAPVTFETARATCKAGTRLPTLKELLTLVDEQPHQAYDVETNTTVSKHIDPQAFGKETPVDRAYWSSSLVEESPSRVWTLDFASGETPTAESADARYVRCVRFQP